MTGRATEGGAASCIEDAKTIVQFDASGVASLIHAIDADPLTDPAVIDRMPRWSPDGRWIAYFSNRDGAHYQLWKIRPDGSDVQQLTEADDDVRFPVWSPDGSQMAVTVIGRTPEAGGVYVFDPNRPWRPQGIVTYSLRTGTYDRLTDFGELPVWLSDNRRVMFVSGGKELFVVDTATKTVRKTFSVRRDVIGLRDSLICASG